eukprot:gene1150-3714_t
MSLLRRGQAGGTGRFGGGGGAGGGSGGGHEDKPINAAGSKKAKWKMQSDQLRQAMKASRMIEDAKAKGIDIRKLDFGPPGDDENDDRVPCPHCGRKFNAKAADRHIPHCATARAKPNFLSAGGGKKAHMRNK